MVCEFEPLIVFSAVSMEPTLDPLSPSLLSLPTCSLFLSFKFIFFLFFLTFYLFLRQRETEHDRGRDRERGRHRIGSRLQALNHQPRTQRGARTHGLRDRDLSRSQRPNRLSHPGAPKTRIINWYIVWFSLSFQLGFLNCQTATGHKSNTT